MNNVKVKEIIKFSISRNIQNKWFIIFNLIVLFGTIIGLNFGNISNIFKFGKDDSLSIEVIDSSDIVYEDFLNALSGDSRYSIKRVASNDYTSQTIPNDLMIIEVIEDETEAFKVTLTSQEAISVKLFNPIKEELYKVRNNLLCKKYGVEKDKMEIFQKELSIERIMLSVESENSGIKETINFIFASITYIVAIILFSKMASEIASEKQSKATEYILTTVSAKEYLYAKVFSNIAVVLIQGLFIIAYYIIAILISNMFNPVTVSLSAGNNAVLNSLNKDIVFSVILSLMYIVLNLILLCIIQATLASKTSSTSEAGNSTSLLSVLMMIGYFVTIYVLSPYSKVSLIFYIFSCVPVLSMYFVPGMLAINQASVIQIIVSLSILIVSIPLTFNYCSKVFKAGILDYTKSKKKKRVIDSEEDECKKLLIKRDVKRFGFVIGLSIIIYVGVQVVVTLIGGTAILTLLKNIFNSNEITMILQIMAQVLSLGIAIICVNSFSEDHNNRIEKKKIDIKKKIMIILISLVVIYALQILLSTLLYPLLGLDYDTTDIFNINSSSRVLSKVLLVITLAIIPAIFEEMFFRKAIIGISSKYGKIFALVFSAMFFGMLHMNLSQALFAFIIGLIFGGIYIYTGDIKISMFIHFINNGVAALLLILPEIGAIIFMALFLTTLLIGLIMTIKFISQKENRKKIIDFCKIQVNLKQLDNKYKYIFYEYTFDISLVLLVLLGIATEKLLR